MTVYSYEEAAKATSEYFGGDELATHVFLTKYALQDLKGNIYERTPEEMHRRLAKEFARIELKYPNPLSEQEIYELFSDWSALPQGGPMSAIGNPYQVQSLSNCFVIDSPHDSYGGILRADQEQVQIMKRRGGVGFDISTIRPAGLPAANAARTTDGIGVFMERFSNTCREVAQGGRRGALMLTISCHHPQVLTFANIKRDLKKVTGANVSIRVTDEFLRAVENGEKYQQRFPVDKNVNHLIESWVDAREVWNGIISATRDCSEPGLLFWDTITSGIADCYASVGFETVSTNPCAELPLSRADACRLMLINLTKFVKDPFTRRAKFDERAFALVVNKTQRLMDDLVDLEIEVIEKILKKITSDPEPEDVKNVEKQLWERIMTAITNGRRTGLGLTGLGDLFAYLNVSYGSDESIDLTDRVYKILAIESHRSSVTMAKERGAFPVFSFDLERGHKHLEKILSCDDELREQYERYGRRNIANTTTAPAGSTSLLTQTTSGCEPVLFLKARRKRKITPNDKMSRVDEIDKLGDKWQYYDVFHKGVELWSNVTGNDRIEESPYYGSTVEDIDFLKKIMIQAKAQHWIDHSISNTLTLPGNVTNDVVSDLCLNAWKLGCKGITVYRTGSRDAVIVKNDDKKSENVEIKDTNAPKRPKELRCDIHRTTVQGEAYLVLIGLLNDKPYEVFAGLLKHVEVPKKSKHGVLVKNGRNKDGIATYNLTIPFGDDDEVVFKDVVNLFDNPIYGAFTRTISLALRHGVPVQYLVEQLRKDKASDITSFSSCIARVLSKSYIPDGTKSNLEKKCPQCGGSNINYQQGCSVCGDCGYSRCA